MKKLFILLTIILIFLIGCNNEKINESPKENIKENNEAIDKDTKKDTDYKEDNDNLKELLPDKSNYKWIYNGTAEYGHKLILNNITDLKDRVIYSLKGKVIDVSNGEAEGDFNISLLYTIKNGELIQNKDEEKMLDSKFNEIIIIKTPLKKGNTWKQEVINKDGKKTTLNCEITNIKKEKDTYLYEVRYDDINSDYYEERKIKENIGIISFKRYMKLNEDAFDMGYSLYEKASGYLNELKLKSLLPPLDKNIMYHGLAEYGHMGVLSKQSEDDVGEFLFKGKYRDGSGLGGEFKIIYTLDYAKGIVIERVTKNSRKDKLKVNSIIPNLIILKLPFETGNSWHQRVNINDKEYNMEARIIDISYKNKSYYPPDITYETNPIIKVRYLIKGIDGYFNDTYIEEREFQVNKGMISFSNLMKGDLGLSGKELNDEYKINQELINNMFGYGQSFIE
ncbi:MAG: hypothetical protein FH751_10320 [Firmicutes bacterium]|nr:hypothetical protein [Bacillota bacterium]